MEGSSNNASDTDSELIKKITDATQHLHEFMSLVAEWQVENDAQRTRLDQMAADLKKTITTIESVTEKMISTNQSLVQPKTSTVAPEQVKKPQKPAPTVQVKQEKFVNDDVVQPSVAPENLAAAMPKMVDKSAFVRLDRIHPIKIESDNGAITISSIAPVVESAFSAQLIKRSKTDTLVVPKASKSRRLSFSQSALSSSPFGVGGLKKEVKSPVAMNKKRAKANTSIPNNTPESRRQTRSQCILDDVNNLLASLANKKRKH